MEQEGGVVSAIDKMREAFDSCTVMAGVENDFECVYITKAAAMLCLAEIDEENAQLRQQLADVTESMGRVEERCAKLRELVVLNWEWAHSCCGNNCKMQTNDCGYQIDRECNYEREIWDRMRELGVEA